MTPNDPPFFRLLPIELVVSVLERVPYEDLVSCAKTCHRLHALIKECVSLRYKTELAVAGMEDNPFNALNKADKLSLLKKYRRIWDHLSGEDFKFTEELVSIHEGPAWEFTGGVLAQSVGKRAIEFKQLPSSLRGIPEKTWTTQLNFNIVDFTADPGQDLLVTIHAGRKRECKVHFLSMSTGERHREAHKETATFERNSSTRPTTHEIRISGPYVGVLLKEVHSRTAWCHLSVWDWRSGHEVYAVTHPYWSFAFVDEHYLLLADFVPQDPFHGARSRGTLVAMDIHDPQRRRWCFNLPACVPESTSIYSMELLCEPGARFAPPPSHGVPFQVSRDDRLVVLMVHVSDDRIAEDYALTFSMLASRLLACLRGRAPDRLEVDVEIPWKDWGERDCRAEFTPVFWEGVWPCCVYGTKHIMQEEGRIVVHDYNPHAIAEAVSRADAAAADDETLILDSTGLEENPFSETVMTRLPYRKIDTGFRMSEIDSVMLSEDSIVVVRDEQEQFHIRSL